MAATAAPASAKALDGSKQEQNNKKKSNNKTKSKDDSLPAAETSSKADKNIKLADTGRAETSKSGSTKSSSSSSNSTSSAAPASSTSTVSTTTASPTSSSSSELVASSDGIVAAKSAGSNLHVIYDVEHLATFSTAASHGINNRSAPSQQTPDDDDGTPNTGGGSSRGSTDYHKSSNLSTAIINTALTGATSELASAKTATTGTTASANIATTKKNASGANESAGNIESTAESGLGGENNQRDIQKSRSNSNNDDDVANHSSSNEPTTTPKVALQRLFALEKLSGIWTQRMQIELDGDFMHIVDCETNSVVERFSRECVTQPEAFNQYNDIYNNIIVFIIKQRERAERRDSASDERGEEENGEIHIFQCVSHGAQKMVTDIEEWKKQRGANIESPSKTTTSDKKQDTNEFIGKRSEYQNSDFDDMSGGPSKDLSGKKISSSQNKPVVTMSFRASSESSENVPIANVNVKETVQVFNQIAALREKRPTSPAAAVVSATASKAPADSASQKATNSASSSDNDANRITPFRQKSIRASLGPKLSPQSTTTATTTGQDSHHSSSTNAPSNGGHHQATSTSANKTNLQANNHKNRRSSTGQQQETDEALNHHPASPPQVPLGNQSSSSVAEDAFSSKPTHNSSYNGSSNSNNQHKQQVNGARKSRSSAAKSSDSSTASSSSQSQIDQSGLQFATSPTGSNTKRCLLSKSILAPDCTDFNGQAARLREIDDSKNLVQQVSTNESYVSVLNHCFDDIEKFIIRLQQAVVATRELQVKTKKQAKQPRSSSIPNGHGTSTATEPLYGVGNSNKNNGHQPSDDFKADLALLSARARGPSEDDYFEILSKFKLAFNLLAKLKGCIHDPNAPELVHFLFTPLSIIVESARNTIPPVDLSLVGIPYLNQDAIDLLSNCCSSKESDLWFSLGPNWTETIDPNLLKGSRLPSSFQPIFSDGWAPIIGELELIGLLVAGQSPPAAPSTAGSGSRRASSISKSHSPHQRNQDEDRRPARSNHQHQSRSKSSPNHGFHPEYNQDLTQQQYMAPSGRLPIAHDPIDYHYQSSGYALPADEDLVAQQQQSTGLRGHRLSRSQKAIQHYNTPSYGPLDDHHLASSQFDELSTSNNYSRLQDPYADQVDWSSSSANTSRAYSQRPRSLHSGGGMRRVETRFLKDLDHEAMHMDLGPSQVKWLYELRLRESLIVRVLFSREANNDKELSVRRGEVLEVVDDTRKWWKVRNINLQVAYVPHTIVAVMDGYQTLDELLALSPSDKLDEVNSRHYGGQDAYQTQTGPLWGQQNGAPRRNNPKSAGAFRYF